MQPTYSTCASLLKEGIVAYHSQVCFGVHLAVVVLIVPVELHKSQTESSATKVNRVSKMEIIEADALTALYLHLG